jgi:hypothetical protein
MGVNMTKGEQMKIKALGIAAFLLLAPLSSHAGIGLKAGLNFANVTSTSSINAGSRSGFVAGIFFGTPPMGLLGFRTEFLFSRQGYDFGSNTTTGSVQLDYLIMPSLMVINIANIVQIQAGGQISYLLKANVSGASTGDPATDKIMDVFNRFDYGLAGGVEITPFKGLLIGARINLSLGNLYKDPSTYAGGTPSFFPGVNAKNNVFQLYTGYQF